MHGQIEKIPQVATDSLTELASDGMVGHSSGVVPPEKMPRALSSRHTFIGCFCFTLKHTRKNKKTQVATEKNRK